jgi:hypothetical protein
MNSITLASGLISPWIVLPLAAIAIFLLMLQAVWTHRQAGPVGRRQIRTAGATLHLFTVVALAIGIGIVDPADKRLFVMTWLVVMVLVGMAVFVALLDVLYSLREARAEKAALKREFRNQLTARRPTAEPIKDKPGA